jgi:acyl-CoA synthetase (AMP-forming)/AMP-acid ligase II
VTYTFGSPSIWSRVGPYCEANKITLPTLKRILMAGAPVRGEVLAPFAKLLPNGDTFIPYGATESLPIATIRGSEVLRETWAKTREGKGYCVGRPVSGADLRVLRVPDGYVGRIDDCGLTIGDWVCAPNEIGEICVAGNQVTREYFNMPEQTAGAKIYVQSGVSGPSSVVIYHRLGDMGYYDEQDRLWFCGRKAHRVLLENGTPLYSVCVEALYNERYQQVLEKELGATEVMELQQSSVPIRSALVRLQHGAAIVLEGNDSIYEEFAVVKQDADVEWKHITKEFNDLNKAHGVQHVFLWEGLFPTDIRHNAKINREELGRWAQKELERTK